MNEETQMIQKLQSVNTHLRLTIEKSHQTTLQNLQQISALVFEKDELIMTLSKDQENYRSLVKERDQLAADLASEKLTTDRLMQSAVVEKDKYVALIVEQQSFRNAIKNEQLRAKKLEADFMKKEGELIKEINDLKKSLQKEERFKRKLEIQLEDEKQFNKIEKKCYEENMKNESRELLKYTSDTSQLRTVEECKKEIAQLERDNLKLDALVVKKTEKIHNICILYLRLKQSKDFVTTKLKCLIEEFDEISSDLTEKLTECRNEITAMAHLGSRGKHGTTNPPILQIVQKNAQLALENAAMRLDVCHMKQVLLRFKPSSSVSAGSSRSQELLPIDTVREVSGRRPSQARESRSPVPGSTPTKHKSEFSHPSVYTPSRGRCSREDLPCVRDRCLSQHCDSYYCKDRSSSSRRDVCYCREQSLSTRRDCCYFKERSFSSGRERFVLSRWDGCRPDRMYQEERDFCPRQKSFHRVNQCGDGNANRMQHSYVNSNDRREIDIPVVRKTPYSVNWSHNELNLGLDRMTRSFADTEKNASGDEKYDGTRMGDFYDKQETAEIQERAAVKKDSRETVSSLGNTLVQTRSAPEIMQSGQMCKLQKGVTFSPSCTK